MKFLNLYSFLAGSLCLSCTRLQLTASILLLGLRSDGNRRRNFPCSAFWSTCYAWTNIVDIISEKNLLMFRNVTVQYKCNMTKSFQQDRTSPASVWKYYVIKNGSSYPPPHVSSATSEMPANQPDTRSFSAASNLK